MSFPENEYSSINNRLNQGKLCYTTRVYKEFGIYREGTKYNTPWNQTIVVIQIQQFSKIAEHPFYSELTSDQRDEIYRYSEKIGKCYELIAFKLVEQQLHRF
jgi:hypothetical protein